MPLGGSIRHRLLALCLLAGMLLAMGTICEEAQASDSNGYDSRNQKIDYQYKCENKGSGLSAVDVLVATQEHNRFLELLSFYDKEGFAILTNVALSDKTIWAPSDAAFNKIESQINKMGKEEIKNILGYHISPPQSSPNGNYQIITPDYLKSKSPETFRTRTGVLTGSDQRIISNYANGKLFIQDVEIRKISWCNEAGSVFSLNQVITKVQTPSAPLKLWNKTVRILLYDDIRFFIYSTVGSIIVVSTVLAIIKHKATKKYSK